MSHFLDLFFDGSGKISADGQIVEAEDRWVHGPGRNGSRCVVLKPQLTDCPKALAHYVIAHELAHAYLHNGGWGASRRRSNSSRNYLTRSTAA